jgi:acetate---CoA ligase (ADP-forming)
MGQELERILNPSSVAIIGVSRDPLKFSHAYLSAVKSYGYSGRLSCVNPKARSIANTKCYKSVRDVPGAIDLAIVFTPKQSVRSVVEDCIEKKVGGLAILTGGFGEVDSRGQAEERDLVNLARQGGLRIIGPNCLGPFSAKASFEGCYAGAIPKGDVGLVFQSGNLIKSIVYPSMKRGFGFSHIISLGNQADLEFHECIRYLRDDPDTKAIGLYIEGLRNGREFLEEVAKTVKTKPVVVLKVGRSELGARIAGSHTASLAGSDELNSAAFRQAGAIRVQWPSELVSILHAFSIHKLPDGDKIAIMSDGGGDSALVADNCEAHGLNVVKLSQEKQKRLRQLSPPIIKIDNPLDWGVAQASEAATLVPKLILEILDGPEVDAALLVGGFAGEELVYGGMRKLDTLAAREISKLVDKCTKPIIFQSLYGNEKTDSFKILRSSGIYIYTEHAEAVECLSALCEYALIKNRSRHQTFRNDGQGGAGTFDLEGLEGKYVPEPKTREFLHRQGIRFPESKFATDAAEAVRYSDKIGYPVALKVVSQDVVHKTEAGGVRLNLRNRSEVEEGFDRMKADVLKRIPNARILGVLVDKMAQGGVEVIIGGIRDKTFGPCIMFGFGGTFVELLRNVSFRVTPVDSNEVKNMVAEVKGHEILNGFRGGKTYDTSALTETILTVAKIIASEPEISEIELNPVSVQEKGVLALDARIILR